MAFATAIFKKLAIELENCKEMSYTEFYTHWSRNVWLVVKYSKFIYALKYSMTVTELMLSKFTSV
jgi:hypothetical protein